VVSTVSAVSAILAIFSISRVNFSIILLLLCGQLAMRLKKSSLRFGNLNPCVSDCEQIGHHLGFLYGNLLHSLDIAYFVVEGIDDLGVLDIRDSVPDVTEIFHVVL
jgi:hypothetical protein